MDKRINILIFDLETGYSGVSDSKERKVSALTGFSPFSEDVGGKVTGF